MGALVPNGEQTFLDGNGDPLSNGQVFMYVVGTTTFKDTWQDAAQTTANTNPIILDSAGRAIIYGVGSYRQVVRDANGALVWDQDTGAGGLGQPAGIVYAEDYGLRQGGSDAQAIQAAVNFAAQQPDGATVYLGPGPISFTASDQVIWPSYANGVNLKGDGPQTTVITVAGNLASDVLVLTAGNLAHCQICDLGFNCTGRATSGALINFANNYAAHVENVRMAGGFWNGVLISGGSNQYLCTLRDLICPAAATANACVVVGDDVHGLTQGVYIDTCKFAASAFGVYVRNGAGISISDTECLNHTLSGVITSPAPGEFAKGITMSNFLSDSCGLAAVNVGHSGGTVVAVSIVGGSYNNSQNGIIIGPNPYVNNVSIIGAQIHVNRQSAVVNFGANAVEISGCAMAGNGTQAANTYDVVVIQGGCILCGVDNNVIGAATGFPAMHRHAISLLDTVNFCTVLGNKTGGPSGSGPINIASSGGNNVVANNTGT